MNIVINPIYSGLKDFVRTMPARFDEEGRVLHSKRNVVRLFDCDNLPVVVKRYKVPMFYQRVAYTFFRPSKARRAYEYALRLKQQGIPTPEAIAYIETKRAGLFRQGYFFSTLTEKPDLKSNSELLTSDSTLLDAFVGFLIFMHGKGFLHGDLNLSNVLFERKDDGWHFEVIDTNRSRFVERPTREDCLSNLMRMTRNRQLSALIVGRYAELRGWNSTMAVAFVAHEIDKYERKRKMRKFYKNHLKWKTS